MIHSLDIRKRLLIVVFHHDQDGNNCFGAGLYFVIHEELVNAVREHNQ